MEENNMKQGCVTFLDVLGWKGIYLKNNNAINDLNSLITEITEEEWYKKQVELFAGLEINIISDTVVITTKETEKRKKFQFTKLIDNNKFIPYSVINHLEIHGKIIKEIFEKGAKKGLFFRGATSLGEFKNEGNVYLGKAIDEAADWHENMDWIGCILSPSTSLYLEVADNYFENIKKNKIINENGKIIKFAKNEIKDIESKLFMYKNYWIKYDKIPVKKGLGIKYCLKWNLYKDANEKAMLINYISPLTKNISDKYINTFEYMNYLKDHK